MDKDDYNYISPGLAEWLIAPDCKSGPLYEVRWFESITLDQT